MTLPGIGLAGRCQLPSWKAWSEIVAKHMNKKQQMRSNRATVHSFLDVRTAVLNKAFEDAFRHRHPAPPPANDDQVVPAAA